MKTILTIALVLALGACRRDEAVDTTQTTGATVTPLDQSNARADIDLTASIRRSLIASEDLSMNAKNVKIISRNGSVTLRGVVENDSEKLRVQDEAVRIAGVLNVDNELDVRK